MESYIDRERPIGGSRNSNELPDWALGPFTRETEPVLETTHRGWESGRIFNMAVIEKDGMLLLFYRATPDKDTDLDSRIGLAFSDDGREFRRHVENPIIDPECSYEQRGTEDPKVYKKGGTYYLFYNCAWESEEVWGEAGDIQCNICLATSKDLIHWEKQGQIVPASLSGGWAKGATIPVNPQNEPVQIDGEYLMYVGELDTDVQLLGRSDDLINWEFEEASFLEPMPDRGIGQIHEPATMLTDIPGREDDMILTFNYSPTENSDLKLNIWNNPSGVEIPPAGQVLYNKENPTEVIDFAPEPAGSWGGIINYDGQWLFPDQEGAYFARAQIE